MDATKKRSFVGGIMKEKSSRDRFSIIIAIAIIAFGLFILLHNIFPAISIGFYVWPFVPVLLGFILINLGFNFHEGAMFFFCSIGTMTMIAGFILFVNAFLKDPYLWSYAWALIFPFGLGVGRKIAMRYSEDKTRRYTGNDLVILGVIFFLIGGLIFELVFRNKVIMDHAGGQITIGYILVCLGIYILVPKDYHFKKELFEQMNEKTSSFFRSNRSEYTEEEIFSEPPANKPSQEDVDDYLVDE